MSAIISDCGLFRYRLERSIAKQGIVIAFFGVNPSTASAEIEDQTTMKWRGFSKRNGARKYIAGNLFSFRATDVKELAAANDPIGPDNARHIAAIIEDADVLVPCWGNRSKLPKPLRVHMERIGQLIRTAGKPVRTFGLTKSGDPRHTLMLGYDTPLIEWPSTTQDSGYSNPTKDWVCGTLQIHGCPTKSELEESDL